MIPSYRWSVRPKATVNGLESIHPILRQVLVNRGLTAEAQAQAFLEGHYLESRDPFLLAGMETAVERIQQAMNNEETIVVYGDFDADGVTATVLLTEALRGIGFDRRQVWPYIPDRVDEGYGLNCDSLTALKQKGANLIISVDCGIRSPVEVAHARSIGLDIIVTDHHSLGRDLPPATAVINPKRSDSDYPEKMLAGVGIAYKLAQALVMRRGAEEQRSRGEFTFNEEGLLDLVAIGTVADLAPLMGENRLLVAEGLGILNEVRRPGIAALMNVAGLEPGSVSAESIAFALGPRINAAGRLAHAYDAAKLLAANNHHTARELAKQLNELNRERQKLTHRLCAKAEEQVDATAPIIIAGDSEFRSGIVGLVAGRLAEKHYRPTIIMEQGETESRGSCRSIAEFHITHALDQVGDLLVRHGGHAQAAGFTIRNENLLEFKARMTELATTELDGQDLRPSITADAEIALSDIDWALHGTLAQLEPTGQSNPIPRFLSRGVKVMSHRQVGQEFAHLQLFLANGSGSGGYDHRQAFPAIAFRQGAWGNNLPPHVDLIYTINVNKWQGNSNLQLVVEDIRPSGEVASGEWGVESGKSQAV
jgi:single-stranded-DNA-specific exonuclease